MALRLSTSRCSGAVVIRGVMVIPVKACPGPDPPSQWLDFRPESILSAVEGRRNDAGERDRVWWRVSNFT